MDAQEYRRRAKRCLMLARQTANLKERARTVETAMMWLELAEWAEGKWPQGKQQQQVEPEELVSGLPLRGNGTANTGMPE
jgi:hypothetical protein